MGAGHDGAARELVHRLQRAGHEAEMRDFMTSAPLKIGDAVKASYEFQMKHFAWTYDLTYRLWYLLPFLLPPVGRFMAWLTRRRLLRWVLECQADVVVSTYPLASVVLGQLRRSGRLNIPAINFITDFGVHPLWVHHGIDLNLAVHPRPAAEAATKSGRPAVATGPMVSSRFAVPQNRTGARAALALSPADRAVLIVAGSWGVGDVA
jgi:UDP-N-acetylglucosamine:LPS N-acetylglucosamine transferase